MGSKRDAAGLNAGRGRPHPAEERRVGDPWPTWRPGSVVRFHGLCGVVKVSLAAQILIVLDSESIAILTARSLNERPAEDRLTIGRIRIYRALRGGFRCVCEWPPESSADTLPPNQRSGGAR